MNRNPQFGGGVNDFPPPAANRTRQQMFLFVTRQGIINGREAIVEYFLKGFGEKPTDRCKKNLICNEYGNSFFLTDELIVFTLQLQYFSFE